ncbi:MAG: hypothetical protein R2744_11420 [Bacteroidales bacterium]
MKQKIYWIGIISFIITILGTLFKIMHYPGAGWLLTIGFFGLIAIFFPLALINSYRKIANNNYKPLYIVTYLTFFVLFTGMLFKIMHWPGAGLLLLIGLPFPFVVFLPVFLVVTSRVKNYSIYNTVIVLLLLTFMSVFNALLALGVAKSRLNDSAYLASQYYNQAVMVTAKTVTQTPGSEKIIESAETVLKLIKEARDKFILGTRSDYNILANDPYYISYLDSKSLPAEIMFRGEEPFLGERLDQSIIDFIQVVGSYNNENMPSDMAKRMLEFGNADSDSQSLTQSYFRDSWTAWSMVYLGLLENNVLLIRNELIAGLN